MNIGATLMDVSIHENNIKKRQLLTVFPPGMEEATKSRI